MNSVCAIEEIYVDFVSTKAKTCSGVAEEIVKEIDGTWTL
jgi:hypothetical protein